LPAIDRIYPKSDKFATGVESNATGDSKLNYSAVAGKENNALE